MGNSNEYSNPNVWTVKQQFPYYQLLVSPQNIQVERYFVTSHQISHLYKRKDAPPQWVQLLAHYSKDNVHYLIIQRLKRLSQFDQISFNYGVYVLKQAIKAYLSLSRIYGRFVLTQEMFGIDSQNKIKMWIHENFASHKIMGYSSQTQQQMILRITRMIGNHLRQRKHQFMDILPKAKNIKFTKTLTHLQNIYNSFRTSSKVSLRQFRSEHTSPRHDKKHFQKRKQTKTSQFQCQVDLSPRVILKSIYLNSPRYHYRHPSFDNRIIVQKQPHKNTSIKIKQECQSVPSEYSTSVTLYTNRDAKQFLTTPEDSIMKRVKSESSFISQVELFGEANLSGCFGKKARATRFPLNLPISTSINQVPSKEVIVFQESTIIRGALQQEQHLI